MTPTQIELARHALGLKERQRVSYRNHFVAGPGHPDYADWMAMVREGVATRIDGKRLAFGGDDMFKMTHAGAKAVLRPGESLDSEDFPAEAEASH